MAGKISTPRDAASHYNCPMSAFPLHERAIYTIVMAVLWAFSKVMWRWHLEDAEKVHARRTDGVVIICNHTSMAEVLPIVTSEWAAGRRVRPIFKSEFNKTGIVRWAFALAGGIPVDRGEADMAADALDSKRETAPLTCADDAVRIDSTSHTIDEIVSMIEHLIAERR